MDNSKNAIDFLTQTVGKLEQGEVVAMSIVVVTHDGEDRITKSMTSYLGEAEVAILYMMLAKQQKHLLDMGVVDAK